MERLTHKRSNGIKSGYWSPAKKEELVQRLAAYEDTGITSDQLKIINEEYSRMSHELAMFRQQNRWTPVSLALPDVQIGMEDGECPEFNVMIKDACRATTLRYAPDGAWFDDSGEVYEVVAWMPLPEPYKEDDRNDRAGSN